MTINMDFRIIQASAATIKNLENFSWNRNIVVLKVS